MHHSQLHSVRYLPYCSRTCTHLVNTLSAITLITIEHIRECAMLQLLLSLSHTRYQLQLSASLTTSFGKISTHMTNVRARASPTLYLLSLSSRSNTYANAQLLLLCNIILQLLPRLSRTRSQLEMHVSLTTLFGKISTHMTHVRAQASPTLYLLSLSSRSNTYANAQYCNYFYHCRVRDLNFQCMHHSQNYSVRYQPIWLTDVHACESQFATTLAALSHITRENVCEHARVHTRLNQHRSLSRPRSQLPPHVPLELDYTTKER